MVLRIHVVRQGGHHYYVHDLVPGRAEGSRVAGEEPGTWVGDGARSLGLSGPVVSPSFAEVLEGRDPASGRTLRASRGERRVAGYDLTFCAPKSVSLLHLLAPREIAEAAGSGHHRAVADALDYLGREGVGVRRTRHHQVSFLGTTGPVAGQFLHRTSRALDPHLHTHVVVANVAEGVDGVWSSVDSRRLHVHLGAAQSLYHARLRLELGDRMGAAWEVRPSGLGDIVGVDPGLCRLFSQRSASMDEFRHRWGVVEARRGSRTAAFHADRPEKDRTVTVETLMAEWKQRAVDLGFDLGDLTRSVGVHARPDDVGLHRGRLRGQLLALTGGHRAIGRRHLVAALAASTEGGATARDVEMAAARLMEACGARSRTGAGAELGTGDGRSAAEPRWDPAHVLRVVEGLRFEDTWRDAGPAVPTERSALDLVRAPTPELGRGSEWDRGPGWDRGPEPVTIEGIRIDGPTRRHHKVDAPSAMSRSLGIER